MEQNDPHFEDEATVPSPPDPIEGPSAVIGEDDVELADDQSDVPDLDDEDWNDE